MIGGPAITVSEALVRALWLVEHRLVDRATKELVDLRTNEPDWAQILKRRLESCRAPHERAATTAVDRFLADPPALFDHLDCLSALMLDWRHGLPNLRAGPLVRRLSRLVDPDSLLCLAALDCPAGDRLDWGAVPMRNHGNAAGVLRDGSLDTHVHLGGILAPLFFWEAVVGGEFPLDALTAFPLIRRRHASAEEWKSAIARAMRLRLVLAAWVQEFSASPGVSTFAR